MAKTFVESYLDLPLPHQGDSQSKIQTLATSLQFMLDAAGKFILSSCTVITGPRTLLTPSRNEILYIKLPIVLNIKPSSYWGIHLL